MYLHSEALYLASPVGQACDVLNVTENIICCKTSPKPDILRTVYPGKLPEEMAISALT